MNSIKWHRSAASYPLCSHFVLNFSICPSLKQNVNTACRSVPIRNSQVKGSTKCPIAFLCIDFGPHLDEPLNDVGMACFHGAMQRRFAHSSCPIVHVGPRIDQQLHAVGTACCYGNVQRQFVHCICPVVYIGPLLYQHLYADCVACFHGTLQRHLACFPFPGVYIGPLFDQELYAVCMAISSSVVKRCVPHLLLKRGCTGVASSRPSNAEFGTMDCYNRILMCRWILLFSYSSTSTDKAGTSMVRRSPSTSCNAQAQYTCSHRIFRIHICPLLYQQLYAARMAVTSSFVYRRSTAGTAPKYDTALNRKNYNRWECLPV